MRFKVSILIICLLIILASIIFATAQTDRLVFELEVLNIQKDKDFVEYDPSFYSIKNGTRKTKNTLILRNYYIDEFEYTFNITQTLNETNISDYCNEDYIFCTKDNTLRLELPQKKVIAGQDKGFIVMDIALRDGISNGKYDFRINTYEHRDKTVHYAEEKFYINIGEENFRYSGTDDIERGIRSLQMTSILFISVVLIALVFIFIILITLKRE
jgi:hypothetical protein